MRSASAAQTVACADATTSGRASARLSAVARLIGKRKSAASNGADFRCMSVARGDGRRDSAVEILAGRPRLRLQGKPAEHVFQLLAGRAPAAEGD